MNMNHAIEDGPIFAMNINMFSLFNFINSNNVQIFFVGWYLLVIEK
jgi:hypothetical protein